MAGQKLSLTSGRIRFYSVGVNTDTDDIGASIFIDIDLSVMSVVSKLKLHIPRSDHEKLAHVRLWHIRSRDLRVHVFWDLNPDPARSKSEVFFTHI